MTDRTVLFVCVGNAGKSVMAEALLQHSSAVGITALSAGTNAKHAVNPLTAEALSEIGIDVSSHTPRQLTDELLSAADLVVVLGSTAQVDADAVIWDTDEPSLRGIDGIERMRLIRDDIAGRVAELSESISDRS